MTVADQQNLETVAETDHLQIAKNMIDVGRGPGGVEMAKLHVLVDIAESLRALRPAQD